MAHRPRVLEVTAVVVTLLSLLLVWMALQRAKRGVYQGPVLRPLQPLIGSSEGSGSGRTSGTRVMAATPSGLQSVASLLNFITYSDFRSRVRTGDLFLTRKHTFESDLQAMLLSTDVTHVALAIVEDEGNPLSKVYMYEASAMRGSQVRDFESYVRDGVNSVWWRPLPADVSSSDVLAAIERRGTVPYSWRCLRDAPLVWAGIDLRSGSPSGTSSAMSCGDLVAAIYADVGMLRAEDLPPSAFPRMFMADDGHLAWLKSPAPPALIQFDDIATVDAKRQRQGQKHRRQLNRR